MKFTNKPDDQWINYNLTLDKRTRVDIEVLNAIGLNPIASRRTAMCCILANLVDNDRMVFVDQNKYKTPRQMNVVGVQQTSLVSVIKTMVSSGLLTKEKGFRSPHAARSPVVQSTDALKEYLGRIKAVVNKGPVERVGYTCITDDPDVMLVKYNRLMMETDVSVDGKSILNKRTTRVFKEIAGDKLGGRFYGKLQLISKDDRAKNTKINGGDACELDYVAQHPAILYALHGLDIFDELGEDPYAIDGQDRKHIKIAVLVILGTANMYGAIGGLMKHGFSSEYSKELYEATMNRFKLFKQVKTSKRLPLELQRIDSDIMYAVLSHFTNAGIPVIPVHDSVIIACEHKMALAEVMHVEYANRLNGVLPLIDLKG